MSTAIMGLYGQLDIAYFILFTLSETPFVFLWGAHFMIRNVTNLTTKAGYLEQSDAPGLSTLEAQAQVDRFESVQDLPPELNGMISLHDKNVVLTSPVTPKRKEPVGDREEKLQTLVGFHKVFSNFELATLIAKYTNITGLFGLTFISPEVRATIDNIIDRNKLIVHEKLNKNAWMIDSATKIEELAVIEHRMLKAVESLRSTPVVPPRMERETCNRSILSYVCILPTAGGLLVQVPPNNAGFFVSILGGNIVHKNVDAFFDAEMLYADGTLCLGYEYVGDHTDMRKVIRRLSDWERLAVLPSGSNDMLSTSSIENHTRWTAVAFDSDRLLCFHVDGEKAGLIEVYDALANNCQMTWFHLGVTTHYFHDDKLITFSQDDGMVKIWKFDHQIVENQFCVGAAPQRIVCGGTYISAMHAIGTEGRWSCYTTADGKMHVPLTDTMNGVGSSTCDIVPFPDKTIVLGNEGAPDEHGVMKYVFHIISPEGKYVNSFAHECSDLYLGTVYPPVIFMDEFIVTCAPYTDVCIWKKTGKFVDKREFPAGNPVVISGLGEIVAMNIENNIITAIYRWSWKDIKAISTAQFNT